MATTRKQNRDRILWTGENPKILSKGIRWDLFILLVLIILMAIGGALFYVWSRIQVIQLGYEISNALKEEKELKETNKKLRVEIATLKSCSRIERYAVEELGMAKPKPEQVVIIR